MITLNIAPPAAGRLGKIAEAMTAQGPPDELLLRRTGDGDNQAFEVLFSRYQNRIRSFVFGIVGDASATDQITVDTMFTVYRSARQFRGGSKVSTWIFGIARRQAYSWLRQQSGHDWEVSPDEDSPGPPAEGDSPERVVLRAEQQAVIQAAIKRLSPPHREVILLTFYAEFTDEEISQIAGVPVETVKTRRFYAKKRLQAILGEFAKGGSNL